MSTPTTPRKVKKGPKDGGFDPVTTDDSSFDVEKWTKGGKKDMTDGIAPPPTISPSESYELEFGFREGVNSMLKTAGKSYTFGDITDKLEKSEKRIASEQDKVKTRDKTLRDMRKTLAVMSAASSVIKPRKVKEIKDANGDIVTPTGTTKLQKAHKVFNLKSKALKEIFDFDIPVWTWDGDHPHVPEPSKDYIFRHEHLLQFLWGLTTNKKMWLSGHTGTGKSTLVKEIAARLNWPMLRVNFDSEITRMDLIGRDTLFNDGGTTTSKFVDGILPQAMVAPYILLCDEMDFVRPDVAYVMQRALEDEGLCIAEDGGRMIVPHEMFRIIATGNTQGQGDDSGIYQGARAQSTAFLDRFTVWLDIGYLPRSKEQGLIKKKVPILEDDILEDIMNYVTEHRKAFVEGRIIQPLSPRGIIALAEGCAMFNALDPNNGVRKAVQTVILNRANAQDRSVLNGLVDRTFRNV